MFIYRLVCSDCVMDVYDFSSSVLSKNVLFHWQLSQRPRGEHCLDNKFSSQTRRDLQGQSCNICYLYCIMLIFMCNIYILSVEKSRLGFAAHSFSWQNKKDFWSKKKPWALAYLLFFFFSLIELFGLSLKKKLFNFWFMRLKGHVFKLFFAVMRPRKKMKAKTFS